jgi:hypothetical protein
VVGRRQVLCGGSRGGALCSSVQLRSHPIEVAMAGRYERRQQFVHGLGHVLT